jgi:hypothetical protein
MPVVGSCCSTLARIHSDPGETWHAARSLGLPTTAANAADADDDDAAAASDDEAKSPEVFG